MTQNTNFIDNYSNWIVRTFGYNLAVRIENIVYGLSMIFIGMIIIAILAGIFIRGIHSVDTYRESNVQIFHIEDNQHKKRAIQIRNLREAFEQILVLAFSSIFTVKRYEKRDERRTKHFVRIIAVIAIFIIIWGIFTTFTVLRPI